MCYMRIRSEAKKMYSDPTFEKKRDLPNKVTFLSNIVNGLILNKNLNFGKVYKVTFVWTFIFLVFLQCLEIQF